MTDVLQRTNQQWLADLASDGAARRGAFEELREMLRRGLLRALSSRKVDDDVLEDFVQDALVKIQKNLASFRGDSKFTTWATAIAIRTAYTELRRARWKDISLDSMEIEIPLAAPEVDVEGGVDRERLVAVMYRIIEERLSEKQRTALLSELAGVPQASLVEKLGTNRNALYKLVHDARRRLRQEILDAGFSDDDVRRILDL